MQVGIGRPVATLGDEREARCVSVSHPGSTTPVDAPYVLIGDKGKAAGNPWPTALLCGRHGGGKRRRHGYLSEDKFRRRATILHFDSDQRFDWPIVVKGVFGRPV